MQEEVLMIFDEDLVAAGVDLHLKVDAGQELDLGYMNLLETMMEVLVVC